MKNDDFGNRIKGYEKAYTDQTLDGDYFVARIDGRSFSKFTSGMKRPYDVAMSWAMINTTKKLMNKTDAVVGYTQSDEISLAFKNTAWFDGKIQKLSSVLSGIATAAFLRYMLDTEYKDKALGALPHFDCRVFTVPNETELTNALLWRVHDAKKNAISMAARANFSHNKLQGKSGPEMIEMMRTEKFVDFEDYADFFKYGTFLVKDVQEQYISQAIWDKIPDHKKPANRAFMRSIIRTFSKDVTFNDISELIG